MNSWRFWTAPAIAFALAPLAVGARPLNNVERAVVIAIQEEMSNAGQNKETCIELGHHLNAQAIFSELKSRKLEAGPCLHYARVPITRNKIGIEQIKEPLLGTFDILVQLSEITDDKQIGNTIREGTYEVRVRAGTEPELLEYRPAQALERVGQIQ